jgi:hypothetical protein
MCGVVYVFDKEMHVPCNMMHDPIVTYWYTIIRPVRSAYQPPASSTFLSQQTSHQQPGNNIFLSQ